MKPMTITEQYAERIVKLEKQVEEMKQKLERMVDSDDDWYVGGLPMKEFARQTLQSLKEDKPNDHKPML